ncbi:PepSY domain-containing protein [Chthonobacter rhizosphaerae]|uniref:PepSY domain-containing protein n=1 Tax=Chthonobacter rhizosphaerae TaxID=2735553 RepID=UPI001AEF150C|nr:PepSY domain-containing protein [Chthonobacter rhizosphaerae]
MTRRHRKSPIVGAFLAAALAATAPTAAAADCLSAREAQAAIASGEAMRLSSVARRVDGDIVNAELCESGGRLVYRLAVMGPGGRVVTIVVDARTGAIAGGG